MCGSQAKVKEKKARQPPEKEEVSTKEIKEPQQRTYSQEKWPWDFTASEKQKTQTTEEYKVKGRTNPS